MKLKLLLAFFICLATAFASYSQQGRSVEERVKTVMDKLTPALKLTAEQAVATDSVYTNYYRGFEKMREQMQDGTRPDRTVMEKMTAERDAKLKKIFSEEQYKNFKDKVEASLRPQRNGGRNNRR